MEDTAVLTAWGREKMTVEGGMRDAVSALLGEVASILNVAKEGCLCRQRGDRFASLAMTGCETRDDRGAVAG